MPDSSGQADIRGLDIQKLAVGFSEENRVFKNVCRLANTSGREIRWYQKTSGFLTGTTTTGMTSEFMDNTDQLALPTVVERTWTRNTSYVRKYFVESPLISDEDIKDSDPDILAGNLRDLVIAIDKRVDARIYSVMTEDQTAVNILTTASTAAWDAGSGQDIIKDLMVGKRKIRAQGYNPEGAFLLLTPQDHESMLVWLISTKGSSIPSFASEKIKQGVVMEILGLNIIVSENVVADSCAIVIKGACVWKSFMPLRAVTINEPLIGTKIRVAEEGEAILEWPKMVHLTTNTVT